MSPERYFSQHLKKQQSQVIGCSARNTLLGEQDCVTTISQVHILQFNYMIDDTRSEAAETSGNT